MTVTADSPAEPATSEARRGVEVRTASAVWVLIAGAVGLAAALTLTIEKIEILINPDYVPSCSINPVLSCGSVMITPQASAFGFPNPLIGIVSFTIVLVTGVLAVAKVRLPRWYWGGLAVGTLLGVGVHPLADFPEPVPHRRTVPLLHGGLGGHRPAAGRRVVHRACSPNWRAGWRGSFTSGAGRWSRCGSPR